MVYREEIRKDTANLYILKTRRGTDIPRKVMKVNSDIFADFILLIFCLKSYFSVNAKTGKHNICVQ